MKYILTPLMALAFSCTLASAQPNKASDSSHSTPAIATQKTNNPGAPVKGANSFTESQAQDLLKEKGFTEISGLTKDAKGVWRGKASMSGKMHEVAVDYQGNVTHK